MAHASSTAIVHRAIRFRKIERTEVAGSDAQVLAGHMFKAECGVEEKTKCDGCCVCGKKYRTSSDDCGAFVRSVFQVIT